MSHIEKILITTFISIIPMGMLSAADIPWWERPTICRIDPSQCYNIMGAGFDTGMWDAGAKCWGMKYICPDALTTDERMPKLMGRVEIKNGTGIRDDFDTDILNGDCFGTRITKDNGAMALVSGEYVNVYCPGVLSRADETLPNGEIVYGTQPTCNQLARDGYAAILNSAEKCHGKYYDTNEYIIECDGDNIKPARLIVLNGAPTGGPAITPDAADAMMDVIYETAASDYKEFFGE